MNEQEFRKQLALESVKEGYIDQFSELLSYAFQVTETDIEESGFKNRRIFIRSKQPILELSKVFDQFHKSQLIPQIATYPCEVNIRGALYRMGGVTGVGTHPEYTDHGLMRDLV